MHRCANLTISLPVLGVTIFLLLFALLTDEIHILFTAREVEPLAMFASCSQFFWGLLGLTEHTQPSSDQLGRECSSIGNRQQWDTEGA
jgi:hypothetical protein